MCYFRLIFLFEWDYLVSVDSSIIHSGCILKPDAPGRQWSRWCFLSLSCLKWLLTHCTQAPGSRLSHQDMAGAWARRGGCRVLPVTDACRKEVHVPEFTQTSWIQQVTHCLKSEKLPDYEIAALDSTGILFLTGMYIPQDMPLLCRVTLCYLSWARVFLYITMAVTASDRDPKILGPKHGTASASCSSTRLFCASLRDSKHLYQQVHERQK